MPKFSIIVPVYNAEIYLRQCLDSILKQTYSDWECLLINDGSTDNSRQICEEYTGKDSRFRSFHKNNGGAGSARNIGIDNAYGEWITFCDADDWTLPNWLNIFSAYTGKSYECIIQGFESSAPLFPTNNDTPSKYSYGIEYNGNIKEGLEQLNSQSIIGYLWCKAIKHDVIKSNNIRFNTDYNFQEDEEFILRYLTFCKNMVCTKKVGIHYNMPNYGLKYPTVNNKYKLCISMLQSIKHICGKNYYKAGNRAIYALTNELFYEYQCKNIDRKEKLKEYRIIVGKNVLKTHIFWLTKILIYIDFTQLLSNIILNLHSKIKAHTVNMNRKDNENKK